jgi:hypothetical protein
MFDLIDILEKQVKKNPLKGDSEFIFLLAHASA